MLATRLFSDGPGEIVALRRSRGTLHYLAGSAGYPLEGCYPHDGAKSSALITDMQARTSLRLVVSVLLASRSTCALLGGWTRRASAVDHRRGVRLTAVELESSEPASDAAETTPASRIPAIGDEQQIDLAADQIVPDEWHPDSVLADGPGSFVDIFRSSTPYIKMHRGSTMVIHIDTRVLDEERLLAELMDDVALITVLGVMPVLVISIRDQVDARLREMEVQPRFHSECDSIRGMCV